jgi:hypothetical protein
MPDDRIESDDDKTTGVEHKRLRAGTAASPLTSADDLIE